jgi:Sec1-binding region of Mso1
LRPLAFCPSSLLTGPDSDDDTPENTHTQRALAQYYLSTEGALPPWLNLPSSMSTAANATGGPRPTPSHASSGSGSSMYRAGSKPVSLQDIYDSAGTTNQQTNRPGRTQDFYAHDQASTGRQPLAGDRLRNKLRPANTRSSLQQSQPQDRDPEPSSTNRGGSSGYSGRSGFGGGDGYDPYNYQNSSGRESSKPREERYGTGTGNRSGGRR